MAGVVWAQMRPAEEGGGRRAAAVDREEELSLELRDQLFQAGFLGREIAHPGKVPALRLIIYR